MRKFLSLLTAILFAGFMMADNYVKVTATADITNGQYLIVYETTSLAFNGSLATLDAGKNGVEVTIADGKIASTTAVDAYAFTLDVSAGTIKSASGHYIGVTSNSNGLKQNDEASTYKNTFAIDDNGNAEVKADFSGSTMSLRYNASSGDSNLRFRYYKNAGQQAIQLYKKVASDPGQGGGDPEDPKSKTVYCKVAQDWWTADGAAVGIYAFKGEEKNAAWPGVRMTLAENETNVWTATVDLTKYEKIIFTRVNGSGDISDWGAKTADLVLADAGENDLYTITSTTAVWGDPGVEGAWSKYEAPKPAEDITLYLINNQEWETPTAHVFAGSTPEAAWPGKAMTKTADQVNGFDVYSYTFKDNFTSIIFNDGAAEGTIQTVDLAWDKAKPYFVPSAKNNDGKFEGKWYATKADIPAPAVPLEGNIWKVVETTPVIAGSHYIDEALIKVDGVYATTLKANTRTIAGEEFTYALQVRTDGYPTQDNLVGKEKSGSTSLVITAKENVDITLYYNRQVVDGSGTENDNKDIIVFDQAAISTKVTGEFTIDQILEGGNYLNATKKLALEKGHVYTVTASGTTLQLHGIKLEKHAENYTVLGDPLLFGKDHNWDLNNPATLMKIQDDDSYKCTIDEVILNAGNYQWKVVKDHTWNSEQYPASGDYILEIAKKGKYKVEFTLVPGTGATAVATLTEELPEPKFFITGTAALVGEDKAWNPKAIEVLEDSYAFESLAAGDYMLKITVDGSWNSVKGYDELTTVAAGLTRGEGSDDNNICFKLTEASKVTVHYDGTYFFLTGNFYVEPAPAKKYYLKNNWNGAEWAWKELEYNEDNEDYELIAVFGGKGVNINTTESDEGATWIAAEDIVAFDATYELAELGALDTVVFFFDPEAVNSYTGDNGLSALIIGKYVAPVPAKFYITGNAALVGDELAWNPAAIRSDEVSYKLNLKADVDYMLKITIDGTWSTVKGFDALTTVANGLTRGEGENDDNICFKLNADGEVSVHYDGEFFFLSGDFYVEPAPAKKYYLKNNWNGAEWAWKELEYNEDNEDYELIAVFGGKGVNINTAESDEGATWIAAEDIVAFDATYELAELGAMDTVVFFFDPEAVNSYTGDNGLSALIIGKYVAPVAPELADGFYLIGQKGWDIYALNADLKFAPNGEVEGEYVLNSVVLEVGQELKVVEVKDNAIVTDYWYGSGEGNGNYIVTADVAGTKDIYFRPTWNDDWNGHIYIELNQGTGLENLAVEGKAVKVIKNGELFILRDGKIYTVSGSVVK